MVRRAFVQRGLVEVLLPDSDKLWDPTLRAIDEVLTDDKLVDPVVEALGRRHPQSRRRGPGTPAEVVLRMLVLKHLFDWSFDECEREVRGSLVYRPFCRIDEERVPDAKTLIRLSHCLESDTLKDLVERLEVLARQRRMVRGRRLRADTTVVETPIHTPPTAPPRRWPARADPDADAAADRRDGRRRAAPRSDAERRPPRLRAHAAEPDGQAGAGQAPDAHPLPRAPGPHPGGRPGGRGRGPAGRGGNGAGGGAGPGRRGGARAAAARDQRARLAGASRKPRRASSGATPPTRPRC